jgi:hypothetical protein
MNCKISLLSGVAMLSLAPSAYAQSAPGEAPVEEVAVTGIRGSLQRAAEITRDAPQMMDVVFGAGSAADLTGCASAPISSAVLERLSSVAPCV